MLYILRIDGIIRTMQIKNIPSFEKISCSFTPLFKKKFMIRKINIIEHVSIHGFEALLTTPWVTALLIYAV